MQGHMMHCGAEAVPYPALMGLPIPEKTDTHLPIPHHQFFELARDRLIHQGYSVTNPQHFLNREAAHYFALMQIQHEDEEQADGHGTMCALRNSHDKTFAASLAVGAKVFVCDNLSFSGDIVVGRKHTPNIWDELPEIFEGAIKKIRVMRKRQDIRFAEYREAPLDDYTADHLIMETYRQGIINLKRIGAVNKEWHDPSADHGDKSVWRYFNAVTAALGPASTNQLIQLPKKTIDLHLLLDQWCHIDMPDELAIEGEATLLKEGRPELGEVAEEDRSWLRRILN
jgi:hypothetical protein